MSICVFFIMPVLDNCIALLRENIELLSHEQLISKLQQ